MCRDTVFMLCLHEVHLVVMLGSSSLSSFSFGRLATEDELALVHHRSYIKRLSEYDKMTAEDDSNPCKLEEKWPTYVSSAVYEASSVAVGSLLQLTDAVCTQQVWLRDHKTIEYTYVLFSVSLYKVP